MLDSHHRYVPVMDDDTLMGVVSFHDVARAVLEEQGFENQMLKAYIRDWPAEGSTRSPCGPPAARASANVERAIGALADC